MGDGMGDGMIIVMMVIGHQNAYWIVPVLIKYLEKAIWMRLKCVFILPSGPIQEVV